MVCAAAAAAVYASAPRYDAFSSILGEGKPFVGIDNSYLQSGHTVLLALVLVCAFIDLPGFPLTSLPYDVRGFLKVHVLYTSTVGASVARIVAYSKEGKEP